MVTWRSNVGIGIEFDNWRVPNVRKLRTAMDFSFFNALLSRDNDLLSGYLDITKVVFSW